MPWTACGVEPGSMCSRPGKAAETRGAWWDLGRGQLPRAFQLLKILKDALQRMAGP